MIVFQLRCLDRKPAEVSLFGMFSAPRAFSRRELPIGVHRSLESTEKCLARRFRMGDRIDLGMEYMGCNPGQGRTLLRS